MKKIFWQFIKFGIVGLSSTVIDWGIYLILTRYLHAFYLIAKVISFLMAVVNSYIWNRRWTFKVGERPEIREFSKFLMVSLVGLILNALIMYFMVGYCHINDIISLTVATVIVVFWNFSSSRFWVFKEKI